VRGVTTLTPYLSDPDVTLYAGDALDVLRQLPSESVHMCCTSPPFYGLRDYGVAGQIGLEDTPELWVSRLVEVFREVRRVLRADGTLWLEVGDSYAGSWGAQSRGNTTGEDKSTLQGTSPLSARQIENHPQFGSRTGTRAIGNGVKPKDLIGAPWLLAFALRADGWYLRSDIVWSRPNPMPESVTDRPTKAHSYVFLLTKSARYFFDAEAVREGFQSDHGSGNGFKRDARLSWQNPDGTARGNDEPWRPPLTDEERAQATLSEDLPPEVPRGPDGRRATHVKGQDGSLQHRDGERWPNSGRNVRSVWNIATQPFSARALGYDSPYRVSADCPRHGLAADPENWRRAACGEPPTDPRYRIDGNDARRALEPHDESVSSSSRSPSDRPTLEPRTPRNSGESRTHDASRPSVDDLDDAVESELRSSSTSARYEQTADSSDSPFPEHSPTATLHSTGSRRTGRVPATTEPCTPSAETPDRTGDTSGSLAATVADGSEALASSETTDRSHSRKCSCVQDSTDHFATFPEELVRRCILAGTSERGCCPECGAAWVREVERIDQGWDGSKYGERVVEASGGAKTGGTARSTLGSSSGRLTGKAKTLGWEPDCECAHVGPTADVITQPNPEPCVVLDPFVGSGTVPFVARKLGRRSVGIDLSAAYLAMAARRLQQQSLFAEPAALGARQEQ
jgi:DNA modification methylase